MHFNVQDKYFSLIKEGKKTAEGRIYKVKLHNLKVGDMITFSPNSDSSEIISGIVEYINIYKSFRSMLSRNNELSALLPDVTDSDIAVATYEQFGNYKEDQSIYGVVSIGFRLIN